MEKLTDVRWSLVGDAALEIRCWAGEYVVHYALSNDTHRLTELAGRALSALQRMGTVDLDSLACECGVDGEELSQTLAALAELDLIVRC